MTKLRTSYRFRARLKLHSLPSYKIAQMAGLNPVTLSKLVCGALEVKVGDERIIRVGRILGLEPEQCFERFSVGEPVAMCGGKQFAGLL